MSKNYKQLTLEQRKQIEKLYKSGMKNTQIAEQLGKNQSSIYRELQRCPKGQYDAEKAHAQAIKLKKDKYGFTGQINPNPNHKHLKLEERIIIEEMTKVGKTPKEIALVLHKSICTIDKELARCSGGTYNAYSVQNYMDARKKEGIKKMIKTNTDKKERENKKIIKACLKLNPRADKYDIKMATGMPIECIEKYYEELFEEINKKA